MVFTIPWKLEEMAKAKDSKSFPDGHKRDIWMLTAKQRAINPQAYC